MNYKNIYEALIARAQSSRILSYTETHHIMPKCLGGSDDKTNLVDLTPEEHYLAHLLLVKIYPRESKIIFAANMMCLNSETHQRNTNKRYSWLKKLFISECRKRTGEANGATGTMWITNQVENKKIKSTENIPDGWSKGRKVKDDIQKECCACHATFSIQAKYKKRKTCSEICHKQYLTEVHTKTNHASKKVIIDGVEYISISEAARQLGVVEGTIRLRLKKINKSN